MPQRWPQDSQIAAKKDYKNVYLLRNNSNNKEKQIMYAELILSTYCAHIFKNKFWCSGSTNLLFCIGIRLQTVSLLELSILRLILQLTGIYTVLFYQTKIGKNEIIITKESIVPSTSPALTPHPPFCRKGLKNVQLWQKEGDLHFLNFQWGSE